MIHPVKTPLGAARAVTHRSLEAVRHPVRTVGDVTAMGRGLIASVVTRGRPAPTMDGIGSDRPIAEPAAAEDATVKKQGDPLTRPPTRPTRSAPVPPDVAEPDVHPVTEPSAVTGPGDADEIPSPVAQPEEDDVEVMTPVGTTGAGPALNPDTTEADLQQPGTEPLMDPATTKRIKKETDTLRRASDIQKG